MTPPDTYSNLGKAGYLQLRGGLNLAPSLLPSLAIVVLDLALCVAVLALLRHGGLFAYVSSQFLMAIVFFNNFSILHECGHGSVSRKRWINSLLGHYASTFCFIPYFPWKYIHQKHHAWTGNIERDPVLRSLRSWRDHGVPWLVRASWRSWIPLGAALQHLVYITYPYQMWRSGEMTGVKLFKTCLSLIWMPVGYFLLYMLAPDVVRPSNFLLAVLIFLVAEELVNIPHHVDMSIFDEKLPIWEQHRATRSCYYPPVVSELLVLNFNFHTEHHLFPSLPWHRLRSAREHVKRVVGNRYQEVIGISWNLQHRKGNLQTIVDRYSQAQRSS